MIEDMTRQGFVLPGHEEKLIRYAEDAASGIQLIKDKSQQLA
jgi:hypothetical protein